LRRLHQHHAPRATIRLSSQAPPHRQPWSASGACSAAAWAWAAQLPGRYAHPACFALL
jgi:hypothetical protein